MTESNATITVDPNGITVSPGCDTGPQGWHIYDTEQEGWTEIECVFCGIKKSEVGILAELATHEPPPGSVVIQEGTQGSAWQRFYGPVHVWKSSTGKGSSWDALLSRSRPNSRVWLVYVPHRPRP